MQLKIVYIDDEAGLCQSFEDNFAGPSINIRTFTDPVAGVAAIKLDPPDLVLLDYRLPKQTGLEVAKEIPERIPVALITGDLHLGVGKRFLKVFGKPFDFREMEEFLLRLPQRTAHTHED